MSDSPKPIFISDQVSDIRERALLFSGVGSFRYRKDGTLVYIDQGTLKMLDVEDLYPNPAQAIGKNIGDLLVYLEPPGTIRGLAFKDREVRNYEYSYRTLKGEVRWCLHDSFLVTDAATGETLIHVTARDITELKEKESRLRETNRELDELRASLAEKIESRTRELKEINATLRQEVAAHKRAEESRVAQERNLDALFESSPVALLVLDASTNIVRVNAAALALTGGTAMEFLQHRPGNALRCVHSSQDPRGCGFGTDCALCPVRRSLETSIASGASLHGAELPLELVRDGNPVKLWVRVGAEPVALNGERHLLIALEDFTERKRAAEALAQSALAATQAQAASLNLMEDAVEAQRLLEASNQELRREIAEHERAETALRASEERFRALIENAPVAVGIARAGATLYANRKYRELFGYEPTADLAGQPIVERWAPEYRAKVSEWSRQRVLGLPAPSHYEGLGQRKDGSRFPVELYASVVELPDGPAAFAALIDITARKRAEEAQRMSEERFRALSDSSLVGIYILRDNKYAYVNPAMAAIFGYSVEEMIGMTPSDIVMPGELARVTEFVRRRITGEVPAMHYEVQGRYRDGSTRDVEVYGARIEISGKPSLVGTLIDITERKKAEIRLREQAALLDQASDAIFVSDLENHLTYWNRSCERLFGWKAEEVLGRRADDFFIAFPIAQVAPARQALLEHGQWAGELVFHNRAGQPIDTEVRATLARDADGRPRGRLVVCIDVTEKKKIQEQFLRAQRLENLGMLAAGIAHDFNNVLAPIGMAIPLLRAHTSDPVDLRMLKTLEACGERGAGLVRQILGFAHGVSGEPRLTQVKHLLRDLIEVVAQTFPKAIELEEHVPNDLWPVMANPTQIHQVLLNLCVNARDAMPEGGTLRLRAENCVLDQAAAALIDGAKPGAWLALHVEDSGSGIPPEVLTKIWDPFFTTKAPDKGTGLGLSTVRGIVERHRGFVTVQSVVGRGTTFRVYLPPAEMPGGASSAPAAKGNRRGRGEAVLFVDDDENIRETAQLILTRTGYRVTLAADGAEAAGIFEAHPGEFALVVTDLDMPKLDGAGLARAVRTLHSDIRILAISGQSLRRPSVPSPEFADALLAKPFSADELLGAIERLLHGNPAPDS